MPKTILAILAAALPLGWGLYASTDARGQQAPASGGAAEAAPSPPGAGGAATSSSPADPTGATQQVSDQKLQQYVQALTEIARFDPAVATALRRGDWVDVGALSQEQQAEQAMRRAGLAADEVRRLTQQLQASPALKARYQAVLERTAQQQPGGTTGAAAAPSPATTSSGAAGPRAEPGKSPKGE
jgi:hypothetical protein